MNEQNIRNQISRAIDESNQDLRGNPFLAEKIMAAEHPASSARSRRRLFPLITLSVLLIAVTALALISRRTSVGGHGVWTYADGQLFYQEEQDQSPQLVLENDQIRAIDADYKTNKLCFIARASGDLQLCSVDQAHDAPELLRTVSSKYMVKAIRAYDGSVCMLTDTSTAKGQLYRLDGYDGFWTEDRPLEAEDWPNQGVTAFAVGGDAIYAYCPESGRLATFANYDLSLRYPPVTVQGITCLEAGYQQDGTDYVFALSDQSPARLLLINTRTGEKLDTGETASVPDSRLDRDEYNLYVVSDAAPGRAGYRVSSLSGKKVLHDLTIVNGDIIERAWLEDAIRLFNERYPDVEVIQRYAEDDRVIATELMSGEPGIDLFSYRQTAEVIPGEQLYRSGAIRDLSALPELQAIADTRALLHPESAGNAIYALPLSRLYCLWEVNPTLAETIGWQVPEGPWTLEAFETLVDQVIAWNESHEQQVILLCGNTEYLTDQYESTHIDLMADQANLMTDEYLHLLELQKKMYAHHLLLSQRDMPFETSRKPLSSNVLLRADYYHANSENLILPPIPSLEDPFPWLCQDWALYLNTNSPFQEEAVYLVSCLLSPEALACHFGGAESLLHFEAAPEAESVSPVDFTAAGLSERLTRLKITTILAHLPFADWLELWNAMLSGEISPEAYAQTLQQRLDQALGE